MSGIYIPGMEMPTKCDDCEVLSDDLVCPFTGIRGYNGKPEICPLIEVPVHGRLIDADALAKEIEYARFHHSHTDGLAARHHVAEYGHFLNALSEFPAIIPSSKQEVDT